MEQLKKGFNDPNMSRAYKIELYGLHHQIHHSLAYEAASMIRLWKSTSHLQEGCYII